MNYSLALILYSSIVLVACSKQPKPVEPPQVEVQSQVVDENIEVLDDTSEFEDHMEPENGIYESEFVEEASSTGDHEVTQIKLEDLIRQFKQNPAMVELMTFRTTGKILSIKTDTTGAGERIAVVGLQTYPPVYEGMSNFYCAMALDEAAKFTKNEVIDFTGQIIDSGDKAFLHDASNNHTWKIHEMFAVCHSAFLHID